MALLPGLTACGNEPGAVLGSKAHAEVVTGAQAQCSSGNRPYFGDTHLHTALSPDAGLAGTKLGLDEAYRFARARRSPAIRGRRPLSSDLLIFWSSPTTPRILVLLRD